MRSTPMAEKKTSNRIEIMQLSPAARPSRGSWREATVTDHFVQFYRRDTHLVDEVAGFLAAGLRSVEGGVMIATQAHRHAIEDRLEAEGIDLAAARARKQYVPLDAEETLARFMVNRMPDEALFNHVVGGIVTRMVSAGFRVRAFGEMVALLWARGEQESALKLEHLWSDLGRNRRFALLCAYPFAHFEDGKNAEGFQHVCEAHAAFLPALDATDGPGMRLSTG
jgi:MEDS: MEthanogen/methylotroph, DcmR Sensory domain